MHTLTREVKYGKHSNCGGGPGITLQYLRVNSVSILTDCYLSISILGPQYGWNLAFAEIGLELGLCTSFCDMSPWMRYQYKSQNLAECRFT